MEVSSITSWDGFLELESEWDDLLAQSDADPLFMSWTWLSCWVEIWRRALKPYVIVVRDNNNLIGVAPLYYSSFKLSGVLDYRVLRPVADLNCSGEYADFLTLTDNGVEIRRRILDFMVKDRSWDCIYLSRLRGWEGRPTVDAAKTVKGLRPRQRKRSFAVLNLPENVALLEEGYSRNLRKNLRRFENSLAGSKVEYIRCRTQAELEADLQTLFDLHQRRWASIGESGTFLRNPGIREFYRAFAHEAMTRGWLRLVQVRVDDVPRAAQLGYQVGSTFYVIQEGFDPDFKRGVGNLLRDWQLRACVADGLRVYDFLAGDSEHKRRWGPLVREGYDLMMVRESLRTLPLLHSGWPGGRLLKTVLHEPVQQVPVE